MHYRVAQAMAVLASAALTLTPVSPAFADDDGHTTSTPIKHLVVIFQENISFDHYFGTYPNATTPAGEPAFHPRHGTPTVNQRTLPAQPIPSGWIARRRSRAIRVTATKRSNRPLIMALWICSPCLLGEPARHRREAAFSAPPV